MPADAVRVSADIRFGVGALGSGSILQLVVSFVSEPFHEQAAAALPTLHNQGSMKKCEQPPAELDMGNACSTTTHDETLTDGWERRRHRHRRSTYIGSAADGGHVTHTNVYLYSRWAQSQRQGNDFWEWFRRQEVAWPDGYIAAPARDCPISRAHRSHQRLKFASSDRRLLNSLA